VFSVSKTVTSLAVGMLDHPGDPARDFLAAPLVAEPGSAYHYAGGNTYVLGRVVHAISGLDLRDFLVPSSGSCSPDPTPA
jgi:CubicO group peptidase (beta-lactamase class C family)